MALMETIELGDAEERGAAVDLGPPSSTNSNALSRNAPASRASAASRQSSPSSSVQVAGEMTFRESVTSLKILREMGAAAAAQKAAAAATSPLRQVSSPGSPHASPSPAAHSPGSPSLRVRGARSRSRSGTRLSTPDTLLEEQDENIKVMVRVRPQNVQGVEAGTKVCVRATSKQDVSVAAHPFPHTFAFDNVSGEAASQERIFKLAGRPMVNNVLQGYNSCIFAYGQTGAGKTYTMMGPDSQSKDRGITPRVFEMLFEKVGELERHGRKCFIRCSFLEIYNEQLRDLLVESDATLNLREDARKGVHVEGLSEHSVFGLADVMALIEVANGNRRVGSTRMNSESSRSHTVFTCTVEQKGGSTGHQGLITSRLNLVDLAGSERQKDTGATGGQLREACNINRSLSALGHVIMALVEVSKGRQRHVPYRDSRLTFLLQDSLGGNSKTVMVACVSPSYANVGETLSTLHFARNAKSIKNRAVVNEESSEDTAALKRQIKMLTSEIMAMKRGDGSPAPGVSPSPLSLPPGPVADLTLAGALRREGRAMESLHLARERVRGLEEQLAAKDRELQQGRMVIKLREEKIRRLDIESYKGRASRPTSPMASPAKGKDPLEAREIRMLREELVRAKQEGVSQEDYLKVVSENRRLAEEVRELALVADLAERQKIVSEVGDLRERLAETLEARDALAKARGDPSLGDGDVSMADMEASDLAGDTSNRVSVLTQELALLKEQHAGTLSAKMAAEAQLAAATRREEQLEEALRRLEVEHMETQSKLGEAAATVRAAQEQLRAHMGERGEVAREVTALRAGLEAAQRDLEQARAREEEARENEAEAEQRAHALREELAARARESAEMEEEAEALRSDLEMRERELVEASAAVQEAQERGQEQAGLEAEWQLKMAAAEQQAGALAERNRALADQVQALSGEKEGLSRAAFAADERAAALESQLERARAEAAERERAAEEALARAREELESRAAAAGAETDRAGRALRDAQAEARALRERATALESQLGERTAALESQLAEARGEAARARAQEQAQGAELARLEAELAEAQAEVARRERAAEEALARAREEFESRAAAAGAETDRAGRALRDATHEALSLRERLAQAEARGQAAAVEAQEKLASAEAVAGALRAELAGVQDLATAAAAAAAGEVARLQEEARALRERAGGAGCGRCAEAAGTEQALAEARAALEDAEATKRVEVEGLRYSLAQESRRVQEALQKAHQYKKQLLEVHAETATVPAVPLSPLGPTPMGTPRVGGPDAASVFREHLGRSVELRSALEGRLGELERQLLDMAQSVQRNSPGAQGKADRVLQADSAREGGSA